MPRSYSGAHCARSTAATGGAIDRLGVGGEKIGSRPASNGKVGSREGRKLFCEAQASISVPSTEKCSSAKSDDGSSNSTPRRHRESVHDLS